MDDGWRRLLRDVLIAVLGACAASLVVAIVHADLTWVLAAGIGTCVIALSALEGPVLVKKRRLRRASARAGFRVEPQIRDKWIYLGVTNDSDRPADFGASVETTDPEPVGRFERSWPIRWATTDEERQVIDPHGTRDLQLGYCEVTLRDGQLTGSITLRCVGRGDVSFNYDNTDDLARRVPAIKVTMGVNRASPWRQATFVFLVGLKFGEGQDRALPWVERGHVP